MPVLLGANLALRFGLELVVLAQLAYWGFTTNAGAMRFVTGLGVPLLAAVIWCAFVSPNAAFAVSPAARLGIEAAVFGSAAMALAGAGKPALAAALFATAVANTVLLRVWGQ